MHSERASSVLPFALSLLCVMLCQGTAVAELRHHWPLDETEGLTASDQGSGANGTLVNFEDNDDSQWVAGEFAGGLDLGSGFTFDNHVIADVPGMNAAETGGFTILMWLNPGDVTLNSGEYQLVSTPGDGVGFTLFNNTVEGTLFDRVLLFWDGNLPNLAVGSTTLEPGNWYHIAITSTGAGGVKEYYVDGVRETKRLLVPSQGGTDRGNSNGWAAGRIEIGGINGAQRTHNSMMDDVRVYDSALSEDEIQDAMSNPPLLTPRITALTPLAGETFHDATDGFRFQAEAAAAGSTIPTAGIHLELNGADVTANLVIAGTETVRTVSYSNLVANTLYDALIEVSDSNGTTASKRHTFGTLEKVDVPELRHIWKLDETTGLLAVDSASGANATLSGFEPNDDSQWVDGQIDGALDFGADGTFNNFATATVPAMSAIETGGFTIAMWIQPGQQILTPGEYQLVSTPGDSVGFTIYNNTVEGTHFDRVILFWDGNLPNLNVGTTSLEPGTWYHVAITSTGPGGEKLYYINGELEEGRFLVPSQGGVDVATSDGWAAGVLEIGGIGGAQRTHDTIYDDIRIYEAPLSPEEIKDLVPSAPALPPVIDNLVPAAGEVFHLAADDFQFTATAATPQATIAPADIHVTLNGVDVSGSLVIGGTPASRTVAFNTLEAERLYTADIEVTDSAGGGVKKVHIFGTFTRSSEPGLRHHWKLDEETGLFAVDIAGGANATLSGFENDDDSQWVAGQVDGALDFGADATNNNFATATVPAMSATETGGFTMAMWIQPGQQILTSGEYQLISTPGDQVGFTLFNNTVEGTHFDRVLLFWDGNLPNLHVGSTTLEPGTWYHVTITSTGPGGEKLYYVNGELEEVRVLVPSQGGVDVATSDGWAAGNLQIGGIGGAQRTHDTIYDDVRIYEIPLDQDQVAELANAAPPVQVFHRGDADQNGELQLTDAIQILGYLFLGTATRVPDCLDASDTDDNGDVQLTDALRILGFLFTGGPPPATPGPPTEPCGQDPTTDDALDCLSYSACQ